MSRLEIGMKTELASERAGGIACPTFTFTRSEVVLVGKAFSLPRPPSGSFSNLRVLGRFLCKSSCQGIQMWGRRFRLPARLQPIKPSALRLLHQKGASILEAVLFLPILFMLLWGMIDLARIGMVYYELHKMLYTIARYAGSSQNVNFCDDADPTVATAKNLALRASVDESAALILPTLTADLITVRAEKVDPDSQAVSECVCSAAGCDAATGGRGPDYIVVTIPDGYSVKTNIPFVASETFLLRPKVRVPFGGT